MVICRRSILWSTRTTISPGKQAHFKIIIPSLSLGWNRKLLTSSLLSVVDWGFASMVPFQLAGRMPRFLQLCELTLPPDVTLQEDRKTYITSLECQSSTSQVAFWILVIHSPEDVGFRHCYLESLISKGMHFTLARLGWKLPNR